MTVVDFVKEIKKIQGVITNAKLIFDPRSLDKLESILSFQN